MFDEYGGFYDHVALPSACKSDGIEFDLKFESAPGSFDRLGVRVLFVVVLFYVCCKFINHNIYDHTSILHFIKTHFNLPTLTTHNTNTNPILNLFNFTKQNTSLPSLPTIT